MADRTAPGSNQQTLLPPILDASDLANLRQFFSTKLFAKLDDPSLATVFVKHSGGPLKWYNMTHPHRPQPTYPGFWCKAAAAAAATGTPLKVARMRKGGESWLFWEAFEDVSPAASALAYKASSPTPLSAEDARAMIELCIGAPAFVELRELAALLAAVFGSKLRMVAVDPSPGIEEQIRVVALGRGPIELLLDGDVEYVLVSSSSSAVERIEWAREWVAGSVSALMRTVGCPFMAIEDVGKWYRKVHQKDLVWRPFGRKEGGKRREAGLHEIVKNFPELVLCKEVCRCVFFGSEFESFRKAASETKRKEQIDEINEARLFFWQWDDFLPPGTTVTRLQLEILYSQLWARKPFGRDGWRMEQLIDDLSRAYPCPPITKHCSGIRFTGPTDSPATVLVPVWDRIAAEDAMDEDVDVDVPAQTKRLLLPPPSRTAFDPIKQSRLLAALLTPGQAIPIPGLLAAYTRAYGVQIHWQRYHESELHALVAAVMNVPDSERLLEIERESFSVKLLRAAPEPAPDA
ncbi:hypothetical protein BDK51DRAFT_35414, partial [Blyttiomyces helicus]